MRHGTSDKMVKSWSWSTPSLERRKLGPSEFIKNSSLEFWSTIKSVQVHYKCCMHACSSLINCISKIAASNWKINYKIDKKKTSFHIPSNSKAPVRFDVVVEAWGWILFWVHDKVLYCKHNHPGTIRSYVHQRSTKLKKIMSHFLSVKKCQVDT